jgi:AcrR family transcriptional regulator
VGADENRAYSSLKRRQMGDIQRALILSAMVAVCSERGAANVTVARVVAHAGISRRTFYEQFEDCEECLLIALEDAIVTAGERMVAAYDASRPWTERVRAALTALLRFLEEEPAIGRLLVVESLAAGPNALEARSRAVEPRGHRTRRWPRSRRKARPGRCCSCCTAAWWT